MRLKFTFLFLGLSTAIVWLLNTVSFSEKTELASKDNSIFLDAHYHFDVSRHDGDSYESELEKALAHMKSNNIDKMFLLSGGYDSWETRFEDDINVIKAVSSFPNLFKGLCGVDISKDHAERYAGLCLQHKEMIGLKLHLATSQTCLSNYDGESKLREVLERIKHLNTFILIHIESSFLDGFGCPDYFSEVKTLFRVAVDYPTIQFIIAHSRFARELSWIGEKYAQNPSYKKNIWTEISTIESITSFNELVDAWRKFGIDRVLFGSDNLNPKSICMNIPESICDPQREKNLLDLLSSLSSEEQELILRKNIKVFLTRIGVEQF